MNLIEIHETFKTDDDCLEYLAALRWPGGVRCVTCGTDKVRQYTSPTKKQSRRKIYQCQEPTCKQQFTATAGTIFHDTHMPLTKWFMALSIIVDAKKGVSALQLQRHLNCGYKAAWYLGHRIRKAMEETDGSLLTGTVEIDETYVGGKTIRRKDRGKYRIKDAVVGIIERKGDLRLRHIGKGPATAAKVNPLVRENVSRDVERVITDESTIYPFVFDGYCASKHETIRHKDKIYVTGVDTHTNTVESAFSLFKRSVMGTYHALSIKHLQRYLNEREYVFNRREETNRFEETLARMARAKPMPFATLTAEPTEAV